MAANPESSSNEMDTAFAPRPSGKESISANIDIGGHGVDKKIQDSAGKECAQKLGDKGLQYLSNDQAANLRAQFGMPDTSAPDRNPTPEGKAMSIAEKAKSVGGTGFVPPTENISGSQHPQNGIEIPRDLPKDLPGLKSKYIDIYSKLPESSKKWNFKREVEDKVGTILNGGKGGKLPPNIVSKAKIIVKGRTDEVSK